MNSTFKTVSYFIYTTYKMELINTENFFYAIYTIYTTMEKTNIENFFFYTMYFTYYIINWLISTLKSILHTIFFIPSFINWINSTFKTILCTTLCRLHDKLVYFLKKNCILCSTFDIPPYNMFYFRRYTTL